MRVKIKTSGVGLIRECLLGRETKKQSLPFRATPFLGGERGARIPANSLSCLLRNKSVPKTSEGTYFTHTVHLFLFAFCKIIRQCSIYYMKKVGDSMFAECLSPYLMYAFWCTNRRGQFAFLQSHYKRRSITASSPFFPLPFHFHVTWDQDGWTKATAKNIRTSQSSRCVPSLI